MHMSLHPFCLQVWGPAQGEVEVWQQCGLGPILSLLNLADLNQRSEHGRRTCPALVSAEPWGRRVWGTDIVPSAGQRAVEAAHQSRCFQYRRECWGYRLYCRPSLPCICLCILCKKIPARSYLQRRERDRKRSPNLQADGPTSTHSGVPLLYTLPAEKGAKPFLLDPYLKFQQLLIFAISIGL